jgi:Ca-activated chloride channel family protein
MLLLTQSGCAVGNQGEEDVLTLRLLTGSENRSLEPIFERFEEQENISIEVSHQGSVDTMIDLQQGAETYDAVWPASSLWLSIGDTQRVVSRTQSIMRTPVVFAVKRPVAENLGWIGRDVKVEEILAATEAGDIRYMTTSATQSNSGAMAFLGYLYAFAGQPDVLTSDMLRDPVVQEKTTRILNMVDRTAGASGFLRDLFLEQYDAFDGMVNNESAVITANLQLVAQGREPLYVIYPVDGLAIADWPLGFVDHGDPAKSDLFDSFQKYMLSEEVQQELLAEGRRVGIGVNPVGADPAVFNPDWGIDLERVIDPITLPSADVIMEALTLYQTVLRKPSFTVYLLDFSGSMEGEGERDLTSAMRALLEPEQAARYLLQPSTRDITIVIPFNDHIIDLWRTEGNDPKALRQLLASITAQDTDGGTNIFAPIIAALDEMEGNVEGYAPAIILLTDGVSFEGSFADIQDHIGEHDVEKIPVYAILFGESSTDQLTPITEATSGRIFDGRTDLIDAFRQAKGYN